MKYCYFTLISIFITVCYCEKDFPFVSTTLGDIKGHYKNSSDGKIYSAFEGIPYAAPPVGKLRFQDPEPASPWTGIWDATHRYECIQYNFWNLDGKTKSGDEDCLYINVYVPNKKPTPNENLDVIVHIHGGGFMVGSGHFYAEPDYLMDRNVIVVTFNYRLGIFGFLSTGDNAMPGNYGLKDQTMALKWIKEHISSFGGNPNSVTITGGSAGSASVHYHYISPWSKGLFHRGMATSGCLLNPWALQEDPLAKAKLLATSVGCPDNNTVDLVNCLRYRPAALLLDYLEQFYEIQTQTVLAPVIDKQSPNPFVPENPYILLSEGRIANDVPLILTSSADEGIFQILNYMNNTEEMNEKWPKIAPYLLDYNWTLDRSRWEIVAQEIKDFYLDKKDFSEENLKRFSDIVGDRMFLDGIQFAAKLHAKFSKSSIYLYVFNFQGNLEVLKGFGINDRYVPHANEIQYMFTNKMIEDMLKKEFKLTDEEIKMKHILVNFLVSYAKTGIPKISNVEFRPTGYDQLTYLNITGPDDIKLLTVKDLTPRTFWEKLGILENENLVKKDEL